MSKSAIKSFLVRGFISLIGAALIIWACGTIALGLVGDTSLAAITSVRRQGGERTDGRPGRYTYAIGYVFSLPDGALIDGHTTQIRDSVYVKVSSPEFNTPVKYFRALPQINALEEETRPSVGHLVLFAAGAFLIYAVNQ